MRRVLTAVVWGMTILSIFALYAIKYDTRRLEAQVREMERVILRTEDDIAALQAEWAHLTQPERIERLAREHLGYQPIDPQQFATIEDAALAARKARKR